MQLKLLRDYEPEKFASNINKIRPNHVVAGPADWGSFLSSTKLRKDYSFLKTPASGSDSISPEIKERINGLQGEKGCRYSIMEGYGMTEVGSAACTALPNHDVQGSVGVPLPFMSFCIWDNENDVEIEYDKLGEICISGPTLMKGYYNHPQETDDVLKRHLDGAMWMHTGDLGSMDRNGNIWLKGRIKRIIIRYDGQKVSPFQIEEIILTDRNVKECCVVGFADKNHNNGYVPIAYVVLEEGVEKENAVPKIKTLCEKELKEIYQPSEIFIIEKLPLTPNGKVDYRMLEQGPII